MAPKPFGKPTTPRRIPAFAIGALVLLGAAPAAYLALVPFARFRRTVDTDAFFWPSVAVFGVLFIQACRSWMKRRPKPHGPEGASWFLKLARLLIPLLVAAPLALACAFAYRPAITLVNGCAATGAPRVAHAMVEHRDGAAVLRSPYWPPDWHVALNASDGFDRVAPGSVARLTLARGLLGVLWIRRVEIEELR